MDRIVSAIFEGSLLVKSGEAVTEMYADILAAYADVPEVTSLFQDLDREWDRTPGPHYPSGLPWKMVGPFKAREGSDPGFRLASLYTEIAEGKRTTNVVTL